MNSIKCESLVMGFEIWSTRINVDRWGLGEVDSIWPVELAVEVGTTLSPY